MSGAKKSPATIKRKPVIPALSRNGTVAALAGVLGPRLYLPLTANAAVLLAR
jgi:hypothetical protein